VDYRLLCLAALACWGVWGYLSKLATRTVADSHIAFWATVASLVPIAAFVLLGGPARLPLARPSPVVLAAGLAAGGATVAFYSALGRGPASVVIPLTGMYILVPAVLGIALLREPLTLTRLLGLACAALAVLFLSR